VRSVNGLVGETNDGTLNDIRGFHVTSDHVRQAIAAAKTTEVEEGAVGAGTGTIAFGWKGGIGTSSRIVQQQGATWTVGVLVQTNFGGRLTIAGVPIWKELTPTGPAGTKSGLVSPKPSESSAEADGSCMIVVATDAPLEAHDLGRLAARAVFGLARTGSSFSNGSGDYAIAFSTAPAMRTAHGSTAAQQRTVLPPEALSPLFQAALETTEEAVCNSLFRATSVTSGSRTVEALPIEKVRELLRRR
jgi:D-aminopeptidase